MPVFYGNQLLDDDQIYLKLTDTTPLNSATFSGVQGQSVFAFDYVRGLIDVKLNGKRLKRSAYTATNGTSVTLATPIASNYDVLTIDGFIIEGSQNAAGNFLAYGGTANAITLTSNNAQPAKSYKDGAQYRFRATASNTGAATISVDGLPAKVCKTITGAALPSGHIRTDMQSVATYYATGDSFVVVSDVGALADTNNAGAVTLSTQAQAIAGTPGVIPDAEQVRKNHVAQVATIDELRALEPAFDGQQVSVGEFWPDTLLGGGAFVWDATRSKTEHNGVTIYDPEKISELGSVGVFGTFFTPAASGVGCFVRRESFPILATYAGAVPSIELTKPLQAAINSAAQNTSIKTVLVGAGDWESDTVYLKRGVTLQGMGRGVTNFYMIRPPVVEGMVRADRANDASYSQVHGISFFGNGQVPTNPAIMKAVLFQEVKNFVCGNCEAYNFSSYGFWAHTNENMPIADLCEHGLFHDLKAVNVEHAFETKRAKDIRWVRCVAYGDAQYSASAFHPWERSENISYEKCEAYGDFATAAINTLSTPLGNNKDLYFDVKISLNNEETSPTLNRVARVYSADRVTIKGEMQGFSGILWGGESKDLHLDAEVACTVGGFISGDSEIAYGKITGNLIINQSRIKGQGLNGGIGFSVGQNGSKQVDLDKLHINYSADNGRAYQVIGVDTRIARFNVSTDTGTAVYHYDSDLSFERLEFYAEGGAGSSCYFEGSRVSGVIIGEAPVAAVTMQNSAGEFNDGSHLTSKTTLVLVNSSVNSSANLVSDPVGTDVIARAVTLDSQSSFHQNGGTLQYVNAGSLSTSRKLITSVLGSVISIIGARIVSDQPTNDIRIATPNTMINSVSVEGAVYFSLLSSANKSMLFGNIVDVATVNASTGSVISEIVR